MSETTTVPVPTMPKSRTLLMTLGGYTKEAQEWAEAEGQ